MFVSRFRFPLERVGVALLMLTVSLASWGQQAQRSSQTSPAELPETPQPATSAQPRFVVQDYSKAKPAFPNVLAPYTSEEVAPPNLSNSPRVEQLMHNGKLMLSLNDAIALALENNMDIAIAHYNLNIADTDILRAKAGSSILGVNAGIVQNTPGGGVGGLGGQVGSGTGGTNIGSGGVAAGTNGLVSSTLGIGSAITSFDPIVTSTLQIDRDNTQSTSVFTPIPILNQNTATADFAYQQGFQWGTNMLLGFNNTHVTTNNPTSFLTPNLSSNFQLRLTQSLLQGFGFAPNTRYIHFAKNNREITDVAFRLQVITTVDQIENIYWDLVYAFENVRVQEEALASAQKTLSDSEKQVKFGTLPPIQVVSAQSTVATDEQNLIVAQTNLELQQLLMKNALSRILEDPTLAEAEVIPTSTMQVPAQEAVGPIQELINEGLAHRAELAESRIDLNSRELNIKAVRNALLPTLGLYGYYGGSGLGGNINTAIPNCTPGGPAFCFDPAKAPPPFRNGGPVSYAATLNQLVESTAPDKGVGVTLTIPIRNRTAQADQVRAVLEFRQAQMRLQQLENQVRIEVRNAEFALRQNRAAVKSAQAAVDFSRQTLDSEQKKLAAGVSTPTTVLQDQAALTTVESNLVSAMAAYEKSRVELDRATGLLLDHTGILLADVERGEITQMPHVPDVAPRQDAPLDQPHTPGALQPERGQMPSSTQSPAGAP
ncbi:MAG TPA: TolC family protein [Terriglobales bacterium]|nr:TolC family protein [Terriglobales bacterium]